MRKQPPRDPFDPRDPSTWGPSPAPTHFVGNVPPGYVFPKPAGPSWKRRVTDFAKDLSGYSAVDEYVNNSEGIINSKLPGAAAAIGSYGIGKFIAPSSRVVGGAVNDVANFTGNAIYNSFAGPISRMSRGGRMFEASTPMGKMLASTRIMTPAQAGSAQKGLLRAAEKTADYGARAAKTFASDAINSLARQVANKANAVGAGIRLITGLND